MTFRWNSFEDSNRNAGKTPLGSLEKSLKSEAGKAFKSFKQGRLHKEFFLQAVCRTFLVQLPPVSASSLANHP
jgi:hypothetical protein